MDEFTGKVIQMILKKFYKIKEISIFIWPAPIDCYYREGEGGNKGRNDFGGRRKKPPSPGARQSLKIRRSLEKVVRERGPGLCTWIYAPDPATINNSSARIQCSS